MSLNVMSDMNIHCFHTCRMDNGKEYILEKAPFLSDASKLQWLGQGYYLWTDSDMFAHDWGVRYQAHDGYAIVKYRLNVPCNAYLDLVGRVDHQQVFLGYVHQYKNTLQEAINRRGISGSERSKLQQKINSISVSAVIYHLRKLQAFPFKVVKALDCDSHKTQSFQYLSKSTCREKMPLPTRQQVVVYPEARDFLGDPEWHYPE